MKKKISMNGLIKIVPLAILCIVTGMINPVFFAGSNLIDLARSVSFLLIVSVGVPYVLLGASLDMSIGSVMVQTKLVKSTIINYKNIYVPTKVHV